MSERKTGHGFPEGGTLPQVFTDLPTEQLLRHALENGEGQMEGEYGPLYVDTMPDTGRSPNDAYVVRNSASEKVDFNGANKPMLQESFEIIRSDVSDYLNSQPRKYIQNLQFGAENAMNVQLQTESAVAALFLKNLLIDSRAEDVEAFADYTLLHAPNFKLSPETHGTRSDRAIIIDFESKTVVIAGTKYFGEEKKSIFKVGQKELPAGVEVVVRGDERDADGQETFIDRILTMHCSANEDLQGGNTALFFGLSGTGKTTLSTDPRRRLIGDDEHAWSRRGIYNLEGGSYAKGIGVTPESEPGIFKAMMMRGAVAENIRRHPIFGTPILTQAEADSAGMELVENIRFAYPLSHIDNSSVTGIADHPNNIILLTASDVLPPVAKLTYEEAVYHFLTGYTSKMPGTEIGVTQPEPQFSAGYGHPFLIYDPTVYAELFHEKLETHRSQVWLMNTGWPDGFDKPRMPLGLTRQYVSMIINGMMAKLPTGINELGFTVPIEIPGSDRDLVHQSRGWNNENVYFLNAKSFEENCDRNFDKFRDNVPTGINAARPQLRIAA